MRSERLYGRAAGVTAERSERDVAPKCEGVSTLQPPVERLRDLAQRVRRMGLNGRLDPETAYIERDEVAKAMLGVAQALERQSEATARVRAARAQPALSHRLEALLASQKQRIASLEGQLAQANRPRPRRRERPSDKQFTLPLPEEPNGPTR